MKIISVVGARPQFVKLAPLHRALIRNHQHLIIHSGQHYDDPLSAIFFRDLSIPSPEYNLGVGSGSHGEQTGLMLTKIEEVFLFEEPDFVLVYGDTNTTLAGALAASKLKLKTGHVEAGLRSFVKTMPEEINRIVADKLSDLLFCPTETSIENLREEGITEGVHLVGDLMYEALDLFTPVAQEKSEILKTLALEARDFILLTLHRAENTDDHKRLRMLINGILELDTPIVFPVHPRTKKELNATGLWMKLTERENIILLEPVSYLDNIVLIKNAHRVLTDSGGMQKEAYYFGTPTITLRNETEWPETVEVGCNNILGNQKLTQDYVLNSNFQLKFKFNQIAQSPSKEIYNAISSN
ncbi:MAG: UDP-N-acetylglucosamine 2-epimerase (non-hydrolyzing) [candidate division Zixibacteria bacterium]|nr:UDP-N-acetylglucosamine 2-epimerase (non-hydrolyzing) [candidate division Zixibacteria bacterium]